MAADVSGKPAHPPSDSYRFLDPIRGVPDSNHSGVHHLSRTVVNEQEARRIKDVYAKRAASRRERYSFLDPGFLFMCQEREVRLLALMAKSKCSPLTEKRILEVGCGSGPGIREFIKWGARPENLAGIDLLPERVAEARRLCPKTVTLETGNAESLPFASSSFDLVSQSTVFSSILDGEVRRRVADEMLRVLKPGGCILWYDFFVKPPRNPDVLAMGKKQIRRLFPVCDITLRRTTLAPPLTRAFAPYSWLLCCCLERLRLLDTHYIGLIRPGGEVTAPTAKPRPSMPAHAPRSQIRAKDTAF